MWENPHLSNPLIYSFMEQLSVNQQVSDLQHLIDHANSISGWGDEYKLRCFVSGADQNDVIIIGHLEDLATLYSFLSFLGLHAVLFLRTNLLISESRAFSLDLDTPNLKVSFLKCSGRA